MYYPLSGPILDRVCSQILPEIHHKINWLDLEPTSMERKFPSRWFYYLAFFLYGIMMSSAGILHCFIGDRQTNEDSSKFIRLFIVIIDVSLITCIAVTFLFCDLCDIQFFNPESIFTRCLLLSSYFILFLL
ncbi:unnamed protein product [Rotaria sp. Silwood2]|nr:unnamed protein product [Rotaria sp. Silwood2]